MPTDSPSSERSFCLSIRSLNEGKQHGKHAGQSKILLVLKKNDRNRFIRLRKSHWRLKFGLYYFISFIFYQVVLWLYYYYHVASSVILIWNPVNRQYVTKPQTWKEYFSLLFSLIYNQPSVALRAKMLLLSWMLKGHWDQANTKNKTSGIHWVSWVFFNNSGEMPFHLFSLQLSWIQELSWI